VPSARRPYLSPDRSALADYVIRRPAPADRPGLAKLAAGLWGIAESERFSRRWWWNDDEPHCWMAEHRPTGEVAAVCAQRRTRFLLDGHTEPASTVSDWYVAPDHTGAGLGQALVRRGEEASGFMYTSAISESAAAGFGRLGWVGDRRFPMSAGLVPVAGALARRPAAGVDIEHRFVSAGDSGDLAPIDEIWEGLAWPGAAMMVRDAAHVDRHLSLAGGRRYSLLVARRRQQPVGYLLFRTLPPGTLRAFGPVRVGVVADYLVDEADVDSLRSLVGEACRRWLAERVVVMMALSGAEGHRRVFSRLGLLRPVSVGGRLVGARMASRSMHQPRPGAEGSWHLTLADNDTDLILGEPG